MNLEEIKAKMDKGESLTRDERIYFLVSTEDVTMDQAIMIVDKKYEDEILVDPTSSPSKSGE